MQKMSRLDLLEMIKDMSEELQIKERELKHYQIQARSAPISEVREETVLEGTMWKQLIAQCQSLRSQCAKNENELNEYRRRCEQMEERIERVSQQQEFIGGWNTELKERRTEPMLSPHNLSDFRSDKPAQGAMNFRQSNAQMPTQNAESIAECHKLVQTTQAAADEYLQSIYRLRPEAEQQAKQIIQEAQAETDDMITQADIKRQAMQEQIDQVSNALQSMREALNGGAHK